MRIMTDLNAGTVYACTLELSARSHAILNHLLRLHVIILNRLQLVTLDYIISTFLFYR
jgi:hypothetical protein